MTPRLVSGRLRAVALAGIALAAVLLAGCTSDFLVDGSGAAPAPTDATATPEPTATEEAPKPEPAQDFDCVNLLIDRPGNYVIGDCGLVTLNGTGIRVSFISIAELVIRGDGAELDGESLGSVEINGQGAEISAFDIRDVVIRGDENVVVAESTIDTVEVQGNENVVTAGDGILSPVVDNGRLNEFE